MTEDENLIQIGRLVLAAQPDHVLEPQLAHEYLNLKLEANPTPQDIAALRSKLPSREKARLGLLAFVDATLADLSSRLDSLEAIEAQDDAQAADLALFDNSKEAARLHRYEAALFRQLNQCLARLERLRTNQEIPPPQPQPEPRKTWQELHKPEPQPEPNSAPKTPPQPPTPETTKRTQFPARPPQPIPLKLRQFHRRYPQESPASPPQEPTPPPRLDRHTPRTQREYHPPRPPCAWRTPQNEPS